VSGFPLFLLLLGFGRPYWTKAWNYLYSM